MILVELLTTLDPGEKLLLEGSCICLYHGGTFLNSVLLKLLGALVGVWLKLLIGRHTLPMPLCFRLCS